MWEFPVAKSFADSRAHTIYGGSSEIMKELIARDIVADKWNDVTVFWPLDSIQFQPRASA